MQAFVNTAAGGNQHKQTNAVRGKRQSFITITTLCCSLEMWPVPRPDVPAAKTRGASQLSQEMGHAQPRGGSIGAGERRSRSKKAATAGMVSVGDLDWLSVCT
ncbi:hypothetical protein UPYG_G00347450 [Umbra pygmaea]|uniref:Uncharacterized protein n=1 Tax=Umbra pygmaea TaxID=75934 RepID=A0ABD0W2A5_UMBPY